MLEEKPKWTYTTRGSITQWYGHAMLLDEFVLGQWLCVRRDDGSPLWERRFWRPNTIVGIQDGVIVASEMRSDGPWTASFGCYGIELATGRMLWASHRNGLWGKVVRAFDYIPGFTNDLRDTAVALCPGQVICQSGRVLDVRTGRFLHRVSHDEVSRGQDDDAIARTEFLEPALRFPEAKTPPPDPVRVADGCYVSRHPPSSLQRTIDPLDEADNATLYGMADDGTVKWCFRVSQAGYHSDSSPFRFASPYFYFVVSDAPVMVPIHADKPYVVRRNPGNWHALTFDAKSGTVIQDLCLGPCKAGARIEDIDGKAVLFNLDGHTLAYYGRVAP